MERIDKQQLLATPMHKLGLGNIFNRMFFSRSKHSSMKENDILTLCDFFTLNSLIVNRDECFICWRKEEFRLQIGYCLSKETRPWSTLKAFLIEQGFTHKDWIALLPEIETPRGKFPNFSLLGKKVLLEQSLFRVTDVKPSCQPATDIFEYFERKNITVKDILMLEGKEINDLLSGALEGKRLEVTLFSIQRKFKEYKFTSKDGSFMKIPFPFSKDKEGIIDRLIAFKGFTQKDAKLAVELGSKAGWV